MAGYNICPFCGGDISVLDSVCPHCGTTIPEKAPASVSGEGEASEPEKGGKIEPDDPRKAIVRPKTIEELRQYCEVRKMPLERMRFFIGEDYRPPKAFGIYRDGTSFVVYKNKADGSRAVRYHGPDEAYAVNELFEKLLSECHNRNIYPERAFSSSGGADRSMPGGNNASAGPVSMKDRILNSKIIPVIVIILLVGGFIAFMTALSIHSCKTHKHDGYYQDNSGGYYYRYGDDWYYSGSGSDWHAVDFFPEAGYEEYYIGKKYDSDWDVGDFKDSDIWDSISSSDSDSGSDYSDWDSGGTDWDSDW